MIHYLMSLCKQSELDLSVEQLLLVVFNHGSGLLVMGSLSKIFSGRDRSDLVFPVTAAATILS